MKKLFALLALLPSLCFAQSACPVGFTNFNGQCLNNPQGAAIIRGQSGTGAANKGGAVTVQPGTPTAASTAEGDVTLYQDPLNTAVQFKCAQPTAGNIATATCTFSNITVSGAGGGGAPGGAANSVQYNNAGAFGGAAVGADQLLQGTAGAPHAVSVPNCGSATQALAYSTGTHLFSCQTLAGGGSLPPFVPAVTAAEQANNITLSGPQTIDGQALVAGQTALLTTQSTASQNGPWNVNAGAWTRPTWFASGVVVALGANAQIAVQAGTTGLGGFFSLDTTGAVTVDTTAESWSLNECNTNDGNCANADPQFHPNGSHVAVPVVSGVGCSLADANSGDNSGAITAAGADVCTLTFANVMSLGQGLNNVNFPPHCAVAGHSATVLPFISTAATPTAVVFTTAAAGTFDYVCLN